MTMFTLPNFCRVCLKYDKNLIDLEHIENEPSETLMSKLQQCVAEVEWNLFKPLLCHPCIKRLNIAYTFKKQCVQSASMLKSYVALLKEKKNEDQDVQIAKNDLGQAYMMLPNQKYIKIVVGQNQNTFQNVFLNVVPTSSINPPENTKSKDTNQNVFLNINNTFQKYIPVAPAEQPPQKEKNLSVNQLLTESKSEELSVEIDPTDFGLVGDYQSSEDEDDENRINDWEDVISSSQIKSNGANANGKQEPPKAGMYGNFVPILPKQSDDKMEFFNSGQHFLSTQTYTPDFLCEQCQKRFSSNKLLRQHIRDFHLGKFPFKCDYCYNEFVLRAEYEACMKYHKLEEASNSLTLNDFKTNSAPVVNCTTQDKGAPQVPETTQRELTDLVCELCHRQFNSTSGLLRHKVRKHNQKTKKKYFIKGMKNAKCDICNREFSTQSYMQLHRKLHLRDDIGYKYKVFGKNRYQKNDEEQKSDNQTDTSNNKSLEMEVDEVSKNGPKSEDEDSDNGSDN